MPEVFDETIVSPRRTSSTRASRARFASSCSMIASTIQSTPLSFWRSESNPPIETSEAVLGVKNGSGLSPRARLSPSRAASAVTSSNSTATPAFAKCAAICAPIVPAPITPTLRKVVITHMLQCAALRHSHLEGRMIRWLTATCVCMVLSFGAAAHAQSEQVSGTVVDGAGLGIPGATVQLASASRRELATSGQNGAYTFSNVTPGKYQLIATLVGFAPATPVEVVVSSENASASALTLRVASLAETVVVSATKGDIALVDAPATMSVLTSAELQSSPAQTYGDL